jgi:hypothetical protein
MILGLFKFFHYIALGGRKEEVINYMKGQPHHFSGGTEENQTSVRIACHQAKVCIQGLLNMKQEC